MNSNYINSVILDLIENKDYIPIKDNNGAYVINNIFSLLQKATTHTFQLVCLIDVESLAEPQLKQTLHNNLLWVNEINVAGISDELVLTEVLVFSNKPDASQLAILEEHQINAQSNKPLEILIVEIDSKHITEYSGFKISASDLKIALSDAFYKDLSIPSPLPDIDELINRQPQEPTLEIASNKVPATYVLIGINVAIWLIGQLLLLLSKEDFLTAFGIKDNAKILNGEVWRLITPIFLHADIMHISANSFSLLIFGQVIERMFGTRKFLILYFVSGVLGNIASFIFSSSLSLGASGAIMGIGGAFIFVWLKNRRVFSGSSRQYLTFVFLVFFNLFYGFTKPGIDNFAHFGGFIGGFLSAGALYKGQQNKRLFAFTLLALMVIGIIVGFNNNFI